MRNNSKIKKILSWVLKISIVLFAYGFLYNQLIHGKNLIQVYHDILNLPKSTSFYPILVCVILLMMVNWGIESKKWQLLISKLEPITYATSVKAVLAGMTISSFTPNRVGEFIGRVFFLSKEKRWEGVFVTIIGSISQLLITLIVGIIAAIFFIPFYFKEFVDTSLYINLAAILAGIISITLLFLLYYNLDLLLIIARKLGRARKNPLIKYLRVFALFDFKSLSIILLFSFFRYIVFTTQFYLLLYIFNVDISYLSGFMIIALIFFIDAAIPTIVLTEWGVRASLAIFLLGIYFNQATVNLSNDLTIAIVSASTLLWIINLVFPAIIGSIFVFFIKFNDN